MQCDDVVHNRTEFFSCTLGVRGYHVACVWLTSVVLCVIFQEPASATDAILSFFGMKPSKPKGTKGGNLLDITGPGSEARTRPPCQICENRPQTTQLDCGTGCEVGVLPTVLARLSASCEASTEYRTVFDLSMHERKTIE